MISNDMYYLKMVLKTLIMRLVILNVVSVKIMFSKFTQALFLRQRVLVLTSLRESGCVCGHYF